MLTGKAIRSDSSESFTKKLADMKSIITRRDVDKRPF